jgi:hypothetical protein
LPLLCCQPIPGEPVQRLHMRELANQLGGRGRLISVLLHLWCHRLGGRLITLTVCNAATTFKLTSFPFLPIL